MKRSFATLAATVVTVLGLAVLVMAPDANAAGERRGGGGGGGGGGASNNARAGQAQVNNTRADTRTNNVRSTSVNNVNNNNVNVNRNVNVSGNNYNNGWDNDHHPVAAAAAIAGTAALIGSMVRTPPAGCAPVNYSGIVYQQCGGTWYAPQGSQFVVVAPPY